MWFWVPPPPTREALEDAPVHLLGVWEFDYAGWSVAGAGDFDNDGNPDLVVGAPGSDLGGEDTGAAYLELGPVSGTFDLQDAQSVLVGESPGDGFGASVCFFGDLDGDDYSDFAIGALGWPGDGSANGSVYIVQGSRW
jgi:hypothetical protein